MIDIQSGRSRWRTFRLLLVLTAAGRLALAQEAAIPVSRTSAVEQAVRHGARLEVARADTAAARAALLSARALENPTLTGTYSKATPQWHVLMDVPLSYPWIRGARIGAAQAGRQAAGYRFAFERAAAALDADTTYTRALAAREHRRLAQRTAQDADSLLRMARQRLAVGDAAQLDVELATVNAGQQASIAATDSLDYLSTVMDLQAVMGMQYREVVIVLTDSLTLPPDAVLMSDSLGRVGVVRRAVASGDSATHAGAFATAETPVGTAPLQVAAAEAAARGAALSTSAERRSTWLAPAVTFGFETGDPSGSETGILPTVGIGLPLPLLNRNAGPLASARAQQARAEAELQLARVESRTAIARAQRQLAIALSKVERDRVLVSAADRVAAMSLTAYREGAFSLPNVLEAQRNAREVYAQYVDDLAAVWIASATLRVLTLTP